MWGTEGNEKRAKAERVNAARGSHICRLQQMWGTEGGTEGTPGDRLACAPAVDDTEAEASVRSTGAEIIVVVYVELGAASPLRSEDIIGSASEHPGEGGVAAVYGNVGFDVGVPETEKEVSPGNELGVLCLKRIFGPAMKEYSWFLASMVRSVLFP